MKTISTEILKFFLLITISCSAVICQSTDSESRERAGQIINDYFKSTKYQKTENLSLKYQESWLVNNSPITSEGSMFVSGLLLKHEETNSPNNSLFSRTATLNKDYYFRTYTSAQGGKDVLKVDLSKAKEKNNSEVRMIKSKATVLFFPITLQFPINEETNFNYIGIAEAGAKKAYVLERKPSQNVSIKLLFDTESKLLIMWKYSSTSGDGKVSNYDYYLSDYKVFDGVKIPSKIEVYVNKEYKNQFLISDFRKDIKFDSKFFEI
jgi:hypothetical protein